MDDDFWHDDVYTEPLSRALQQYIATRSPQDLKLHLPIHPVGDQVPLFICAPALQHQLNNLGFIRDMRLALREMSDLPAPTTVSARCLHVGSVVLFPEEGEEDDNQVFLEVELARILQDPRVELLSMMVSTTIETEKSVDDDAEDDEPEEDDREEDLVPYDSFNPNRDDEAECDSDDEDPKALLPSVNGGFRATPRCFTILVQSCFTPRQPDHDDEFCARVAGLVRNATGLSVWFVPGRTHSVDAACVGNLLSHLITHSVQPGAPVCCILCMTPRFDRFRRLYRGITRKGGVVFHPQDYLKCVADSFLSIVEAVQMYLDQMTWILDFSYMYDKGLMNYPDVEQSLRSMLLRSRRYGYHLSQRAFIIGGLSVAGRQAVYNHHARHCSLNMGEDLSGYWPLTELSYT